MSQRVSERMHRTSLILIAGCLASCASDAVQLDTGQGGGGPAGPGLGGGAPEGSGGGADSVGGAGGGFAGSSGGASAGAGGAPFGAGGQTASGGEQPGGGELTAAAVFAESEVHDYALELDPAAWQRLQDEAVEQLYAEAELDVGGQHYSRVGLRFKGNLGTLNSCFSPEGERICPKLSLKIKFNEYLPDQRFFGLKRLNFNSMVRDPSLLRERLAYRIFREMGLPAPRAVHARVSVNGEDQGLFTLVEDVDGRFTDDRFAGGDGNLYKEQWPNTADVAVLDARLETGPMLVDHRVLLAFYGELASAADADLAEVVARYMDVDQVLAYLVVSRTIQDWDGLMAFLCDGSDRCDNHNYFLYQHENEARFTLIPWDLDRVLELEPPIPELPDVFGPLPDCPITYPVAEGALLAPSCDRVVRGAVASGSARVAAQVERLLAGPLAPGVIEAWLDEWRALIEPEVQSDARGPGLEAFRQALLELREVVAARRSAADE